MPVQHVWPVAISAAQQQHWEVAGHTAHEAQLVNYILDGESLQPSGLQQGCDVCRL